jgi:hypothetical protein
VAAVGSLEELQEELVAALVAHESNKAWRGAGPKHFHGTIYHYRITSH